jgi:hypothetical protein
MLNIEPGRVLRALLIVMFIFAFVASVTIAEIIEFESTRVVSDQECSQRLQQYIQGKNQGSMIGSAFGMPFDWIQMLYNAGAFLLTRPQQRNESKPSVTVQMRFKAIERLMQMYQFFPRSGILYMTERSANDKKMLAESMGSEYTIWPWDTLGGSTTEIVIDFPCAQGMVVNKVRVQITNTDPTKYLDSDTDTDNFIVAVPPKVDQKIEGSATIVIRRQFAQSSYPYIIKAWPEGRGFDAKSACKIMLHCRTPEEHYRIFMAQKNHLVGEIAMDDYSSQLNSEYDRERDSTLTIHTSLDGKRGGPAWTNGPSHVVVVDFRKGRNVKRWIPLDPSGTTNVKVFSGNVLVGHEEGTETFKVNPNFMLNVASGQEGNFLIFPGFVKPSFSAGTVEAIVQLSGVPGSKISWRVTSFRGDTVIDQQTITQTVPSCGLKEIAVTEGNAEGIRFEDLSGRFPTKTVYRVGRRKIVYNLGDTASHFGNRSWQTVSGNPMVYNGFSSISDFQNFNGSQTFYRYMNAVFGLDSGQLWAQNTIKRYQQAFVVNPSLVRIDRGARVWKLGFGKGFQEIWNQMVSCAWTNTDHIMIVLPNTMETVGGWTPFFVAGAGRVPGCGNGGWIWIAEGPQPNLPPDYPKAPPIPLEIPPIGLDWLYIGNNQSRADTKLHNPNMALQWTPATIIDINNVNNLRQWQGQSSVNNNNNYNSNTNNNTWSNWNNWNNYNDFNNWNNWNNNNFLQNTVTLLKTPVTAMNLVKNLMSN